MSKRTHVGLGCGFVFFVAVGVSETFAATTPSDRDIKLAECSKIEPGNNPRDDLIGVATIRIISPDYGEKLGTIVYDVPDNGLTPANSWGGPR